ncbi:MAG TPA: hypothetical protein ENN28_03655 [Candidatus Uhrbacteria bacterium]|nr:hypothetical protein [Candidatus Uhrbacteria bacterium]
MPNLEQISRKEYVPRFNSLEEIANRRNELTREQILLELTKLRYGLKNETMELISSANNFEPGLKKEFVKLISLVAMSDVPNIEELIENEEKESLLRDINFVKDFKQKIIH